MSYKRKGEQINQLQHLGRDHIKGDYAGTENRGVQKDAKSSRTHSTNVKGRELRRESGKQPVR
jgi:hypothetical protein